MVTLILAFSTFELLTHFIVCQIIRSEKDAKCEFLQRGTAAQYDAYKGSKKLLRGSYNGILLKGFKFLKLQCEMPQSIINFNFPQLVT